MQAKVARRSLQRRRASFDPRATVGGTSFADAIRRRESVRVQRRRTHDRFVSLPAVALPKPGARALRLLRRDPDDLPRIASAREIDSPGVLLELRRRVPDAPNVPKRSLALRRRIALGDGEGAVPQRQILLLQLIKGTGERSR